MLSITKSLSPKLEFPEARTYPTESSAPCINNHSERTPILERVSSFLVSNKYNILQHLFKKNTKFKKKKENTNPRPDRSPSTLALKTLLLQLAVLELNYYLLQRCSFS